MEQLSEALAGGAGAVVSCAALHPLVVAKVKMQARKKESEKMTEKDLLYDVIAKVLRKDGILGLYAGLTPALLKGFSTNFIFYYVMSAIEPLIYSKGQKKTIARGILHGVLAGIVVQLIMSPADTVLKRVLTTEQRGVLGAISQIFGERGFGGFWRGIGPALALTANPGINTVVRTQLMQLSESKLSPSQNFWIGATSKATASITTYPYVLVRTRMQVKGAEKDESTTFSMISTILREGGISAFYKGCAIHILQAVFKEALLNAVRMEIRASIKKTLL